MGEEVARVGWSGREIGREQGKQAWSLKGLKGPASSAFNDEIEGR